VGSERRDHELRSNAQSRLVEWMRAHPEGSTCDEAAAAARIPTAGARRLLRRLAARWLVRCYDGALWKAARLLTMPPLLLRRVECELMNA